MITKIFLFILGYLLGYLTLLIMLKYKEMNDKIEKVDLENWRLRRKLKENN